MSQHATIPSYKAETSREEQCRGATSRPTLRGPGLLIPSKDVAHSKQWPQATSEDDEVSPKAESVAPNDGRSYISNQTTLNTTSTFSSASYPSSPTSMQPPVSSTSSAAESRRTPLKLTSDSFKAFFRRSSSNAADQTDASAPSSSPNTPINPNPSISNTSFAPPPLVTSDLGSGISTAASSPITPDTNLPHSHGATPSSDGYRLQPRSATGLDFRDTVLSNIHTPEQDSVSRMRSSSLTNLQVQGSWPGFSIPASAGVGLKARRLSTSVPDNLVVDTCNLYDEYASASLIPGRRGKLIGKGATATVKIMYKKGAPKDVRYAVKEFRKRSKSEDEQEYERKVKSEYTIAKSLDHPNIVKTFCLCTHSGRWNHVMEYCSHGELFSLVKKNYFQQKDNLCLFKQLVQGVAYLHRNGIAHRDIKLENLLLSNEGYLKITDFGVSEVFSGLHPGLRSTNGECGKELGEIRKCAPGICGSLPYIAPEVLAKKGEYDPRALDTWACAIACLGLLFRGAPWYSADSKDANYARFMRGWDRFIASKPDGLITDTEYPLCGVIFNHIPKLSLRRLILKMLHPDPAKRISMEDVITERCFRTIECCCLEPRPANVAGNGKAPKIPVLAHNHFPPEKKKLFQRL